MATDQAGDRAVPGTREWPIHLRRIAKLCLLVIYLGNGFAGAHVILADDHGAWWQIALGAAAMLCALTAAAFMLRERWMEERTTANLLGLVLAVHAGLSTIQLALPGGVYPGVVAQLYVATAAVGLRSVHLAAFDTNLNGAAKRAGEARP